MKLIYTLLLLSLTVNGQEFQGKATYKTHRKVDIKINESKEAPNDAFQKQFQEQLKKRFQKTFILNFTKATSTYKQEAKLSNPQLAGAVITVLGGFGVSDILYKNIQEKNFVNQKEVGGKRFLIKDTLISMGWKLIDETKNIGKYTCYKATLTEEIEREKFDSFLKDNKTEEKEKITIKTIAWYTPEIPVSNGPEKFWGLPGLILEIQEGNKTIVCSEIVMNPSEEIKITAPKRGKKLSQKEYDEIMDKHTKEMLERFKNKRKGKKGEGISIEIQG